MSYCWGFLYFVSFFYLLSKQCIIGFSNQKAISYQGTPRTCKTNAPKKKKGKKQLITKVHRKTNFTTGPFINLCKHANTHIHQHWNDDYFLLCNSLAFPGGLRLNGLQLEFAKVWSGMERLKKRHTGREKERRVAYIPGSGITQTHKH